MLPPANVPAKLDESLSRSSSPRKPPLIERDVYSLVVYSSVRLFGDAFLSAGSSHI